MDNKVANLNTTAVRIALLFLLAFGACKKQEIDSGDTANETRDTLCAQFNGMGTKLRFYQDSVF